MVFPTMSAPADADASPAAPTPDSLPQASSANQKKGSIIAEKI